jgi:VCBS repeat-containing protein
VGYLLGAGVSLAELDLQATVLGTNSLNFEVEEGHTQDLTFTFDALVSADVLGEYQVVVQKWDETTQSWTTIDGSAEGGTILEIGLLSGGSFGVEQELDPGTYRAFLTYEGVGLSVLSSLEVTGTDFDHTEIGGYDPEPVSGNVITDVNAEGQADDVNPGTIVQSVNGVSVAEGGTPIEGEHGSLTINPDGSYTYTPNADGEGIGQVDQFEYTLFDPETGETSTATLHVQIDSEGQGLVWNEADPSQPATVPIAASDDAGTAGIEVVNEVTTTTQNDAIDYDWLLGALGIVIGDTEGETSFTLEANTETDLTVTINVGSLASLLDSVDFQLISIDAEGNETVVMDRDQASLLDLVGIFGSNVEVTIPDLPPGNYRLEVSNGAAVNVAGGVTVDLGFETTHLDVEVAGDITPATGNVLDDDTPVSSFTELLIQNGASFVEVPEGGTSIAGTYGVLTINPDGSYTYTPDDNLDAIGQTDTFTYQLLHPNGDTVTANLVIEIQETGAEPIVMAASSLSAAPEETIADDTVAADTVPLGEFGGALDELWDAFHQVSPIGDLLDEMKETLELKLGDLLEDRENEGDSDAPDERSPSPDIELPDLAELIVQEPLALVTRNEEEQTHHSAL